MIKNISLFLLLLMTISSAAQYAENYERDIILANKLMGYCEGFSKSIGENDFSYHSFREDLSESLLTRCTNGKMSIRWQTGEVTEARVSEQGFVWIAAMDLTDEECRFDVFIDGHKRFEIFSGPDPVLKTRSTGDGNMNFYPVEIDHHGDAHGYMTLEAPGEWLSPGKPLNIEITGSNAGSNTWIIVYKAGDALSYLKDKSRYSFQLKADILHGEDYREIILHSPKCFAGKKLQITTASGKEQKDLIENTDRAELRFKMDKSESEDALRISDEYGDIVNIADISRSFEETSIRNKIIIINQLRTGKNESYLDAKRLYRPKTGKSLLELSRSEMSKGTIYLMNSSHQDIAWMDTPEKCVIERDTMLLTPLFENAVNTDSYRFDIEDALMLREYIERHPEKKKLAGRLLREGKLSCGSTFIQPYEEMYSGEALARQFYFGARWLKEEFDYDAVVYWNVDVPGRTLQMPQIMKKAGTEFLMFSRFEKGFYKWYSPDGSFITAYSPGHYANAYLPLQRNFFEATRFISESALSWSSFFPGSQKPVIPLLSDWDMSPAIDYSGLTEQWGSIKEIENENNEYEASELPDFRITTADVFFRALASNANNLSSLRGERPAMWLYIHGPSHYQALKASREADILLTKAEKFNSALAALKATFSFYPSRELNEAWEAKIYPDHGWGGLGGDITDNFFLMKFRYARSEATRLLDKALMALSAEIDFSEKYGEPLVVYNSMSSSRTDIAEIELSFNTGEGKKVVVRDNTGKKVPSQLSGIEWNKDGSLRSAKLVFLADNIPSIGYKTYYYELAKEAGEKINAEISKAELSNDFYKIKLGPGGIEYLFDKEKNVQVIDSKSFAGGQVITMQSVGNGAGEFNDIQQPDMDEYDYTGSSGDDTEWQLVEDGDVYTRFKIRQPVKYAEIERYITIYHVLKKIDFDIGILNWEGRLYREFRMVMPLHQTDSQISYEVPYGVLNVGEDELQRPAGERYTKECTDINPRGILNWISSSNDKFGFTMSSDVAVADYIDPSENRSDKTVLQMVLLASRKSCHWSGNDYLQTGDHHFHFSVTTHATGWKNGYQFGAGSNERLDVIKPVTKSSTASIPESMSFFSTENKNIVISTVKKSEDTDALITRLYDIEGVDTSLRFKTFRDINEVVRTNLLEYPVEEIKSSPGESFDTQIGRYSIETYRLGLNM